MRFLSKYGEGKGVMKKNLLFLLIDCLRADVCFGPNRRARTPTLDRLSQQGTTFTQVVSVTSTTSPSVASILTGMYPFVHGITSLVGYKLNPSCKTLAEVFKENGYETCAMVTGPLKEELDLHRGFDVYLYRDQNHSLYTGFDEDIKRHLKRSFTKPWFLFVHLFELHLPRKIQKGFDAREYGTNTYERALSSLDSCLGRVLQELNIDDTCIIIHSDHGENIVHPFLESILWRFRNHLMPLRRSLMSYRRQRWIGHGHHLYEFLIRVPLICIGKDVFPEGKVVNNLTSQIDIFPTIIDFMGLSVDPALEINSRSIIPFVRGINVKERPVYIMASGPEIREKDRLIGVRTSEWKLICSPTNKSSGTELYNIKKDPHELRNLAKELPEVVKQMKEELLTIQSGQPIGIKTLGIEMPEQEISRIKEKLKELGYL